MNDKNLRDLLEVLTVDTSVATLIAIVRKVAAAWAAAHTTIRMNQSTDSGFSERLVDPTPNSKKRVVDPKTKQF